MIQTNKRKNSKLKLTRIIVACALASLGIMSVMMKSKPTLAAERISFSLPIWGEFHVSVDSLEVFAKEGKITPEFQFYAKRLDPQTLNRLREALGKRFDVNHTNVSRITKMPMGEQFLKQMGEVVNTTSGQNGFYAIRSALVLAAADSEGLTAINFMRHFPTKDIKLSINLIFSLLEETENFVSYNEATVEAISQIANTEVTSERKVNFEKLPDLRQTGSYEVAKKTVTFDIDRVRQTQMGFATSYSLDADIYLPRGLTEAAPLAILTHGFTSDRLHFNYLAEHLATHGYVVLVPEHIGSNKEYKDAFLRGELSVDVSPIEFYSRPLDITFLLDELKNNSEFKGLVNWQQVGVLGHSFGGTTALAIAGAPINIARISQVCQKNRPSLNVSILLQCRANYLPPVNSNLRDPRIKAVAVVNPMTSSILGPESMSKISIPTMILAGSKDIVTPFIEEQAHPFLWLTTENKYLGVMVGGNHSSTSAEEGSEDFPELLKGSHSQLGRSYLKAMSLAFFETHLRERSDYKPYLSSTYAKTISNQQLPLYLIKSLTPKQLEQAYGSTPPTPPFPKSVVAVSQRKKENILAQIRNTKTLKIAMRTDAAPFGYVDTQKNLWKGYCEDLADSLGKHLAQKLNIPSGIKVIKLPSSLENRFELVRENTVHLECGPNTIRTDQKNIRFSEPFFVSGTRFLVRNDKAPKVDLNSNLAGIRTGVLRDSTTAKFVQETYPQTKVVDFQGQKGRTNGVKAVTNGKVDAFVSDGVLLAAEIARQNLSPDNYQLIPEKPLTCDYYGLVLPEGDSEWQNTVNVFLRFQQLQNKSLEEYLSLAVYDADYCLNRQRK